MDSINFSALAVLTASLLGSLHCVGMCGGFVIYNTANSQKKILANTLYNLGRLVTYSLLGFAAGLLGYALNQASVFTGISHVTSLAIGVLLILWGLKSFYTNSFPSNISNKLTKNSENPQTIGKTPKKESKISNLINSLYSAILNNKYALGEKSRSFILGLLSTLLPCGWLYSFVAIAAASEDPLYGLIIMSLFWLGSLPALIGTALLSKLTLSPLQKHLPRITAALIILAGFFSIISHFALVSSPSHSCH